MVFIAIAVAAIGLFSCSSFSIFGSLVVIVYAIIAVAIAIAIVVVLLRLFSFSCIHTFGTDVIMIITIVVFVVILVALLFPYLSLPFVIFFINKIKIS